MLVTVGDLTVRKSGSLMARVKVSSTYKKYEIPDENFPDELDFAN